MALLKGTLDVLVLKTLSWGPMHGFEITSWLETRSGGRLGITDAALLQALHRLEERELLTGEWGVTKNERRARYYRLTPAGPRPHPPHSPALLRANHSLAPVRPHRPRRA